MLAPSPSNSLNEIVSRNAAQFPNRIAFRYDDQAISFAEFARLVQGWRNLLLQHGVQPTDRVAILARDSVHSYACFFAIASLRAVSVPLNWRLSSVELTNILTDCAARLIVCDTTLEAKASEVFSGSKILLGEHHVDNNADFQYYEDANPVSLETPVVQIYTSGTTGCPKGVVLSHRTFVTLLSGMRAVGDPWMDLQPTDSLLLSLPQFHIGGLWWAIQGIMAGACGVLMDTFVGWKALEAIQTHRITKVALVPAMMQIVWSEPDFATADLSSVTGLLYGGSPISDDLLQRMMSAFQCDFFQIYGLTETGNMAVCLRPDDHKNQSTWRAAGKALPGVQLRIVDPSNCDLPVGCTGEVLIKSPSVMLEYWRRPQETSGTLHDGWIRTGDAGYLDEQGYLFVCDRIKDMIIYAGENIYPAEIESVLMSHPAVLQAAVIGVPDANFGELVKAFLVLHPGLPQPKLKEMLQFCRGKIADFKIPKSFDFVESIPRNASGKILKHVLRKPYWENLQRQVN